MSSPTPLVELVETCSRLAPTLVEPVETRSGREGTLVELVETCCVLSTGSRTVCSEPDYTLVELVETGFA